MESLPQVTALFQSHPVIVNDLKTMLFTGDPKKKEKWF
jgi:hypothetical protein